MPRVKGNKKYSGITLGLRLGQEVALNLEVVLWVIREEYFLISEFVKVFISTQNKAEHMIVRLVGLCYNINIY